MSSTHPNIPEQWGDDVQPEYRDAEYDSTPDT